MSSTSREIFHNQALMIIFFSPEQGTAKHQKNTKQMHFYIWNKKKSGKKLNRTLIVCKQLFYNASIIASIASIQ